MTDGSQIASYDAVLVVSFGGPEKPEDVLPFLENTLRGRNVPRERLLEVARHYEIFGGRSPINDQNRDLVRLLEAELAARGPAMPVYWGNRNWRPMLADTVSAMKADGIRRALAFVTSAYSSYSGCRQYLENIENAHAAAGEGAPVIDKLRVFYNHPRFIEVWTERIRDAMAAWAPSERDAAPIVYTAHSIPLAAARACAYVEQLTEAARLISKSLGRPPDPLVFQSRSGSPSEPWLGPDLAEHLRSVAAKQVLIAPIGFVSDHMEVVYDLDREARALCENKGIQMARARTPGSHAQFIAMIRDLILERCEGGERLAIGRFGPAHDECAVGCCPPVRRR